MCTLFYYLSVQINIVHNYRGSTTLLFMCCKDPANSSMHTFFTPKLWRSWTAAIEIRNDHMSTEWSHEHSHSLTMYAVLLEALPRSKMDIACHLADLNVTTDIASFVHLILNLVSPSFIDALRYSCGVVERPAFDTICLSYLFTSVAARDLWWLSTIATGGRGGLAVVHTHQGYNSRSFFENDLNTSL